jgi:hypothetical protein
MDFHIILRDENGGSYVSVDMGHEQFVDFKPLDFN